MQFSQTVPLTSFLRWASLRLTNSLEFQPSMKETTFKSAMIQFEFASKQQADNLPSAVIWPSVKADQHGSGSLKASSLPWFPAMGLNPNSASLWVAKAPIE